MRPPERYKAVADAIRAIRAKTLLEIGTWNGERALEMVAAAMETPGPVLYLGFDLFEGMTAEKSKAEFNAKVPTPEEAVRRRLQGFARKHPGFSFRLHKGDTRETLPAYLSSAGAGGVDLVWLDGGHSIETIASDWQSCRKAARAGGIVLLDDYYSQMPADFLVKFGCNSLVKRLVDEGAKVEILPTRDPVVGGGCVQIVKVGL